MKRSINAGLFIGLVIMLAGCVLLAERLGYFHIDWSYMWPLFVIGLGLCFHIGGWIGGRRSAGLFMPGAVLLVYGALFLFNVIAGWRVMAYYWPLFLLGPALGFFEMFLFGGTSKEVLIPAGILAVVGGSFLTINLLPNGYDFLLPVLFIAVGLIVIMSAVGGMSRRRDRDSVPVSQGPPPPGWSPSTPPPAPQPQSVFDRPQEQPAAPNAEEKTADAPPPPWTQPSAEPTPVIPPAPDVPEAPVIPPPPWEKVQEQPKDD